MGLGAVAHDNKNFLGMLGMHGTYEANLAMHHCDLMINVGARFDDRVTGRLDAFSPNSKKIHIDIDPSSINKIVQVDLPIVGDVKVVLKEIYNELKKRNLKIFSCKSWWTDINNDPWSDYPFFGEKFIPPNLNFEEDVDDNLRWKCGYSYMIDFPMKFN